MRRLMGGWSGRTEHDLVNRRCGWVTNGIDMLDSPKLSVCLQAPVPAHLSLHDSALSASFISHTALLRIASPNP